MRLQTKLLLLLIPLIVLPLLALGWSAYSMLVEDARNRMQEQMTTLLRQINIQSEFTLRTARANASLFASTNLLRRYLLQGQASPDSEALRDEVQEQLFSYQIAYPEYYEIRVLSVDGIELIRSALGKVRNLTTDESGTPQFIASRKETGKTHTTFFRNPDTNEPALLVSKPLFFPVADPQQKDSALELHGYLLLTVDLDFLQTHAHRELIGDRGGVLFTDNDGNILFRRNDSDGAERVPPELFGLLKTGIAENHPVTGEFNRHAASFRGKPLDEWLYMFAFYPESELLAKRNRLGIAVALITCITILVTIAALFGVLRSMLLKPVQKLSAAATEIGHGRLRTPIDITSGDEIGELAMSFREMGKNLSLYHEKVRYVANHDSLTGLPNRMMFRNYLTRATAEARRNRTVLAVMFMDIDNFKRINDTLGHQAGDKLLSAFSDRLSGCLRESDIIAHSGDDDASTVLARLAGDEFIILLPGINDPSAADKIARRILEALSKKFIIGNQQEIFITSSVGIALYPEDGEDTGELMKNADIAMYSAKKLGRNNYQYYSSKLNEEAVKKLDIESRLRHAVENGELELHYQPQIDLATNRITGAESLLRWRDPELGAVSPAVFVPIAEEFGLIVPISEWVIQEACRQARKWQALHTGPVTMSINVSAVHFNGQELESLVTRTLEQTGIEPESIELELTETGILHDPDLAIRTMNAFRSMGVKLSLDDFGTGYSSLSYVMNLPIDKLKIDRSFIMNMERDKRGAAIVSAIIAMAHSLGLTVIAEGVETESHMQLLKTMHCDIAQGYYISRPLPADEFEKLVADPEQRTA